MTPTAARRHVPELRDIPPMDHKNRCVHFIGETFDESNCEVGLPPDTTCVDGLAGDRCWKYKRGFS